MPNYEWIEDARKYWRDFRPRYYRSLEESGQLEQALQQAHDLTSNALADLVSKGLHWHEAWEALREEWLFPPGEEDLEERQGPTEDDES